MINMAVSNRTWNWSINTKLVSTTNIYVYTGWQGMNEPACIGMLTTQRLYQKIILSGQI